jgi:2-dehydropantoate 2-reductase
MRLDPRSLAVVGIRIAVVGPGAIGSTVAASLHRAGHTPLLCGRTARDNLDVRPDPKVWAGERIVVPGPVRTDPDDITKPVDLLLLAVKATQIGNASGWLTALCDATTTVCVLQNGVEQVELIQPHCPASTVVPAIVWCPAETQAEGWVRLRGRPALTLPAGSDPVTAILGNAGCEVTVSDDFVSAAWHKLLANAVSGLMVLTGRRAGMFRRDDVAALSRKYLDECLVVARAEGANLDDDVIDQLLSRLRRAPPDMATSMLGDREAGMPLEWDVRNGVILRKARQHELPAPVSQVVVPLLAAASDGPG